jgi:hypothetical protein
MIENPEINNPIFFACKKSYKVCKVFMYIVLSSPGNNSCMASSSIVESLRGIRRNPQLPTDHHKLPYRTTIV